jgi:negative regulator of flagellin synthesis FlgM
MSYSSDIGGLRPAINAITKPEGKPAVETTTSASVGSGAQHAVVDQQADQANVSLAGGLMAQALQSPDVRSDKVAALQASIANGSYNVSSADVADKMIDSLLD